MTEQAGPGQPLDLAARVSLVSKAAAMFDRHDMVDELAHVVATARTAETTIAVIGPVKQGKSTLINAIAEAHLIPIDDTHLSHLPIVVQNGRKLAAYARFGEGGGDRRSVESKDLGRLSSGGAADLGVSALEIEVPKHPLRRGVRFIELPSDDDPLSDISAKAIAVAAIADGTIFVNDLCQPMTASEVAWLTSIVSVCPRTVLVGTKRDYASDWRRVLAIDAQALLDRGITVSTASVSSDLRRESLRHRDRALDVESGFPELRKTLHQTILNPRLAELQATVERSLIDVCDELHAQLQRRRAEISSANRASAPAENGEATTTRELISVLTDGIVDITTSSENQLRRSIRQQADWAAEVIDKGDPAGSWSVLEAELSQRVIAEVASVFETVGVQIEGLSSELNHLAADGESDLASFVRLDLEALIGVQSFGALPCEAESRSRRGLTILRGGYSGMLMFGFLASTFGAAAVVAPAVAPVAGILLGRQALREEDRRKETVRQATAKQLMRRYCDDVSQSTGQQLRSLVRQSQRELRDAVTVRSERNKRSAEAARRALQESSKRDARESQRLVRDLDADIERLVALRSMSDEELLSVAPRNGGRRPGSKQAVHLIQDLSIASRPKAAPRPPQNPFHCG